MGSALGLATLTVLIATGLLRSLDQFTVARLMPATSPTSGLRPPGLSVLPTLNLGTDGRHYPLGLVAQATVLVGSPLIAMLVVIVLAVVAWRRVGRLAAIIWFAAFFVGSGVEVLGKATVTRPVLHRALAGRLLALHAYDSSFPSGHMLRICLPGLMLACMYPRLRGVVFAFCVLAGAMLVVSGAHVITDVVGGVLVAVLLAAAVGWDGGRLVRSASNTTPMG